MTHAKKHVIDLTNRNDYVYTLIMFTLKFKILCSFFLLLAVVALQLMAYSIITRELTQTTNNQISTMQAVLVQEKRLSLLEKSLTPTATPSAVIYKPFPKTYK